MKLVVTGGCGFIGSHFVRRMLLRRSNLSVVNVDKLTYAGRGRNLADVEPLERYTHMAGDISDRALLLEALEGADAVVNFAAETHVDRSILDAEAFLETNVLGVHALLEACRQRGVSRLVHISTDEVYGNIEHEASSEESPLLPSSPYAASKAAGDLLVRAYRRTHGLASIIVRPSNNYGPYQYPEKLIPLCITNLLEGKTVPIYGDGRQIRDWLFVEDCCEAIEVMLERGEDGQIYNVSGTEADNLTVIRRIFGLMGHDESMIAWVRDRPGHDRRYAMRSERIRRLGWMPRTAFVDGLRRTVEWYQAHADWWQPLKAGAFEEYYRRQYARG